LSSHSKAHILENKELEEANTEDEVDELKEEYGNKLNNSR
jgi:hypothetical protein